MYSSKTSLFQNVSIFYSGQWAAWRKFNGWQ